MDWTFTVQDTTGPSVTNMHVDYNPLELGNTQYIYATVSDPFGIKSGSVKALVQKPDGSTISTLTMTHQGSGVYKANWDSSISSVGTHYVDFEAEDNNNNPTNIDNGVQFGVQDGTGPAITNMQISVDPLELGTTQTITCTISDLSGIQWVNAYIQHPDDYLIDTASMSLVSGTIYDGTWESYWVSEAGDPVGSYFIDFEAYDNENNPSYENNGASFTVQDTIKPLISNELISDNPLEYGATQTIDCTVSDPSGVQSVTAYIESPDETLIDTISMSLISGTIYDGTWEGTWNSEVDDPEGVLYYIDISAVDGSPDNNQEDLDNIITFSVQDSIDPSITNIQISDDPLEYGATQTINCTVSDFSGVQSVTVYIESPDETIIDTVSMTLISGTFYDGIWQCIWDSESGDPEGVIYYIDFAAIDVSSSSNQENINNGIQFSVLDTTPPTIQNVQISRGPLRVGGKQTITCTVLDFSGILNVTAYIQYPDENDTAILLMTHQGNGIYKVIWDSDGAVWDTHFVDIVAVDNSSNQNSQESENEAQFTVRNGGTKVKIFDYSRIELLTNLVFGDILEYDSAAFDNIHYLTGLINDTMGSDALWDIIAEYYNLVENKWIPLATEPAIITNGEYNITWDISRDFNFTSSMYNFTYEYLPMQVTSITNSNIYGSWGRFYADGEWQPILILTDGLNIDIVIYKFDNETSWLIDQTVSAELSPIATIDGQVFKLFDIDGDGIYEIIRVSSGQVDVIFSVGNYSGFCC
ncbi:hypothetical protein ES703_91237 [subsurface metagenome]